jgi:hypothetical protein
LAGGFFCLVEPRNARNTNISEAGWWGERPREPEPSLVSAAREDARPTGKIFVWFVDFVIKKSLFLGSFVVQFCLKK